jgi:hypothetical protein
MLRRVGAGIGLLIATAIAACSAGGGGSKVESGGAGGNGNGGASGSSFGNGGQGLIGGAGGGGGGLDLDSGGGSDAPACQQFQVVFERRIPTVFVLVDRSGTMFDVRNGTNAWDPLRGAVLQVIQQLQAEVRFGFGAFTGEQGQTCPIFDKVNPDLNNHGAIQTQYMALARPAKGETPTMMALPLARDALVNDSGNGGKYILFVTDGEPDYCNDDYAICPVDSVVYHLQRLHAEQQITTLVLGLTTTAAPVPMGGLEAWANAGRGLPAAIFSFQGMNLTPLDIYNGCQGKPAWMAEFNAAGRNQQTNPSLGQYSPQGGNAPVYRPSGLSQMELATQISTAIQGVKSCRFDLQGRIKVKLDQQQRGRVLIEGSDVPFGEMDGWHMASETELVLEGAACARWQDPASKIIDFKFPCDVIIPPPQ